MRSLCAEQLGYLHGVGRGALAHLIAAAPDVEPALVGQVVADASDKDEVLILGVQRHGVFKSAQIVNELHAGGCRNDLAGALDGYLLLGFQANGHAVAAHDGDAHAGAAHLQLRQVHYAE